MKKLYNVLVVLTLSLPMAIYLFLSATVFNLKEDYIIQLIKDANYKTYLHEDRLFLYGNDNEIKFYGSVSYNDVVETYGIYLLPDDIIRVNKEYYGIEWKDDVYTIVDIKKFELQKKEGFIIPMSALIGLFGVLLIGLIVGKKMGVFRRRKRLATFLSLATITLFLYGINYFVKNILEVFVIALVSFGIYCIEYLIANGVKQIVN